MRLGSLGSNRIQRAAIGPDPTLARGARRAPRPPARRGNHRQVTIETESSFSPPRSIKQVQFRARPTAALKARPVVVAKAHFGVFAAAVRTPPRSELHRTRVAGPRSLAETPETVRALVRPREGNRSTETKRKRKTDRSLRVSSSRGKNRQSQSDDTLEKVRTIISEQLGTDLDAVAADAKFVDLGADSLDTVEIMMALEEQFEITLDEEGAEKIATVQEAADMIQDQIA